MEIKILGSGCRKCRTLAQNVQAAATAAGLETTMDKVTDIVAIAQYGIMSTPGLVVEGQIVSSGRVPSVAEIGVMLSDAQASSSGSDTP